MNPKRGPGRPRLPRREAHGKAFTTLLTPDELRAVKQAAQATGKSASAWVREVILSALSGRPDAVPPEAKSETFA